MLRTSFIKTAFGLLALTVSSFCSLTPSFAETNLTVTARNWNLFQGDSFYRPNNPFQQSAQHYFIPMLGGTATVSGDWLPANSSLSLTVLNGRGDRKVSGNGFNTGSGFGALLNGYQKVERTDIEAIWQFPVGMQGASLFFGGRYIGLQTDSFITNRVFSGNVVDSTAYKNVDDDEKSYWVEVGGGVSGALDEAKRHLLFGNITLMLGSDTTKTQVFDVDGTPLAFNKSTDTVFGIDTNFGYALRPSDNATLTARYRIFVSSQVDNWSRDGSAIVHGPELQFSYKF